MKKTIAREAEFFEGLQKRPLPFSKYVPKSHGLFAKAPGPTSKRGRKVLDHNIVLENIAHGFVRPNIVDIKLGREMWSRWHEPEHRAEKAERAKKTTNAGLGICLAGMQYFVGKSTTPRGTRVDDRGYFKEDKEWGRKLNKDSLIDAFRDYFALGPATNAKRPSPHLITNVIEKLLKEVRGLEQRLLEQHTRIVSSSLLLVYEGDAKTLIKKLNGPGNSKVVAIGVIDFPYAERTPTEQGPDMNIIDGIRSTIEILEQMEAEALMLAKKDTGKKQSKGKTSQDRSGSKSPSSPSKPSKRKKLSL